MKRILAITGKRGGYEAMLPLLDSLRKSPQLDTAIFCIDQHWMEKFGSTIKKMGPGQLGCAPIALGDSVRDRCLNLGHYAPYAVGLLCTHHSL